MIRTTTRLLPLLAAALLLSAADAPAGYLSGAVVDLPAVLAPAPVKGDLRYEMDRKVYRAMKPMIGTPRWDLATRDVPSDNAAVARDMSCAAGVTISPETTPATFRLLANASTDTARANNAAKDHYKRLRPFLIDKGQTCEDQASVGKSFDYPSGHTTRGWTFGLILAELLPQRATPILARARAYGESRIVCRVHNLSAVEAGRVGATITMTAIRVTPAYQADLAAARAELAAAHPAPDAQSCSTEAALANPSVLAGLKR